MSQTQLSGAVSVAAQGLFDLSSVTQQNLGDLVHSNDGRAYRYAKCGGADISRGRLTQSSAEDTATQNLTAVAAAIGDTTLVSTSTVTITANEYANGLAIITTGPGVGYAYKISGHAAFTSAAPTLQLADPIAGIALTTASRIDLIRNPYSAVIVNPTTASSAANGVSVAGTFTTLYFGWVQVAGVAPLLADGALVVGADCVASNGTAGTVEQAPNVIGTQSIVGVAQTGVATTEIGAVRLQGML